MGDGQTRTIQQLGKVGGISASAFKSCPCDGPSSARVFLGYWVVKEFCTKQFCIEPGFLIIEFCFYNYANLERFHMESVIFTSCLDLWCSYLSEHA